MVVPSGLGYPEALALLAGLLSENRKPKPAHAALEPWEAEILSLISGSRQAMRASSVMSVTVGWLRHFWVLLRDCGLSHVIGQAITLRLHSPESLRRLLEDEAAQRLIAFPLSQTGKAPPLLAVALARHGFYGILTM